MISCVCCIPVVGQFKGRPVETRGPCDFPAYTQFLKSDHIILAALVI